MSTADLIRDCNERNILLSLDDAGGLVVNAPRGALDPDLVERLRADKASVVDALKPALPETAEAAAERVAERWAIQNEPLADHPMVAEAIRLFDAVVIDAWDKDDATAKASPRPDPKPQAIHDQEAAAKAFDELLGQCQRCGSSETVDVPIHDGRSLRRDCLSCGRFLDFPCWRPDASTQETASPQAGTQGDATKATFKGGCNGQRH